MRLSAGRDQTLASFDFQWSHLPGGDFMPGDVWFERHAVGVLTRELCGISPDWFRGKRVLDAGCGRGRWTQVLLKLGAHVTAVDFSDAGLQRTRELAGATDRLVTRRVDLLNLPVDFAETRYDFVFSFGVLHHTGDTRRALANVSSLVAANGGLFLYLYGAGSWSAAEEAEIERLRMALADVPFAEKISELRRRFPGEDVHQLFDLLSPTINERVRFEDVRDQLRRVGFARIDRTIDDTEVYLRATRDGFPSDALLPPIGSESEYLRELHERFDIRRGATAEVRLRQAVRSIAPRKQSRLVAGALADVLAARPRGAEVLDASFSPDALSDAEVTAAALTSCADLSPLQEEFGALGSADVVVYRGSALGAGRFPLHSIRRLAERVRPGGHLLAEIADGRLAARRALWERVIDRGRSLPEKLALLLTRHRTWSTGEALYALGGDVLLSPVKRANVEHVLAEAGLQPESWSETESGSSFVVAHRPR